MDLVAPVFSLDVSASRHRQRPIKVAIALSLLVHALAIAWLPGLRVAGPEQPAPLIVELVTLPPENPVATAQSEPQPEPAAVKKPAPLPPRRADQSPPPVPTRTEPVVTIPAEVQREIIAEPVPQPSEVRPEISPPPPAPPQQAQSAPQPAPAEPLAAAKPQAPTPSVIEPRPALDLAALKTYGEMLAQAIGKHKDYPRLARLRNWQGTTELKLQIGADGKLHDVIVGHSSGFPLLDAAAVRLVQESLPLPELPGVLRGHELTLTVPVVFKLEAS